MAKDNRSRDQKRKANLKAEAKNQRVAKVAPYEGRKYQSDVWTPYVYEVEVGIYDTIELSRRTLTNATLKAVLIDLVKRLRQGLPAALADSEPDLAYSKETEHEYLVWVIRRQWRSALEKYGAASPDDLIGILRTLLNSIEAHRWNTGEARGYVDFLVKFMKGQPPRLERGWLERLLG
ncbi:MAG: hypothetical protein ACJ8F7_00570 [Gemmataceae bacterium]